MKTTSNTLKTINLFLWISQGLTALMFVWGAYAKLVQPLEQTAQMMPWVAESPNLALFSGFIDLLLGIGIVLPAAIKRLPQLTTYAAIATVFHMIAAIVFHITRGESSVIGVNIFLIAIATFIAWGRSQKIPIHTKTTT